MTNLTTLFNTIRYRVRYGSIVEWYNLWYIILRKRQKLIPHIATVDETIRKIVADRCSVSRFGDGEMLQTNQRDIGFQRGDPQLARRLQQVIASHEKGHLVCIPDVFTSIYRYNRKARRFWRTHFFLYGHLWDYFLVPGRQYFNTFVTRPYMDWASKARCPDWFRDMKQIWDDRDIVFIEGEKSRLGVGNDLFDNARSIRRILCPPRDAFDKYDAIVDEAKKLNRNSLLLIALGPTATVLAYDLHNLGFQAIDIGHVDIEYEWWRMGAKRKMKIDRKYVNESPDGRQVADAGEEYEKQIIGRIV